MSDNLYSEICEEYDRKNLFDTPDEYEKFLYSQRPFASLLNTEKAYPLESTIKRYCVFNSRKYNIAFKDLSRVRNFKNRKGNHEVDFVINDFAAIEAKNYDCFAGKGYVVAKRDVNNQVLNKFAKYPNLMKILIIARPWWERGVERYLIENKVHVIELGFVVTNEYAVMQSAFNIIKSEMDKLLYIPYMQYQRLFLSI